MPCMTLPRRNASLRADSAVFPAGGSPTRMRRAETPTAGPLPSPLWSSRARSTISQQTPAISRRATASGGDSAAPFPARGAARARGELPGVAPWNRQRPPGGTRTVQWPAIVDLGAPHGLAFMRIRIGVTHGERQRGGGTWAGPQAAASSTPGIGRRPGVGPRETRAHARRAAPPKMARPAAAMT